MKQFTVAGKVLSVMFALIWMVGCAGTDVTETDGATSADQERRQMEADEAAKRQAAEAAAAAKKAQMALEAAVDSAGNIVYFDFDKSTLTAATRRVLDAHIALAKTTKKNVRLEGHTDERGTREYNMALGERRAKAVADYMSVNGVASYRVETVSYGEERPAMSGSGEAAWSKNRRVEIK
ncbi:MAG: peptidoglycan-associated lipoprotein Pal [Halieaceae bacterium]